MKLELVSFRLCPYVQRSVITLNYKSAPFEIRYIDLRTPPAWFTDISPMGKVPVLVVNGKTAIFESAVINEYIDETIGEPLHPGDPLRRAFERAWIEYGSELLMSYHSLFTEKHRDKALKLKTEFFDDLKKLEPILAGPFFRGSDFSLVDAAYAPLFMRLDLAGSLKDDPLWNEIPRVRAWADSLLDVPAVKASVTDDFETLHHEYAQRCGSALWSN